MAIKLGINGFGRIGRLVFRAIMERHRDAFDVVAVNDLTDAATLGHLLKYDSVHGRFRGEVSVEGTDLVVDGERFRVLSERDPAQLPWGELGCDAVIESTGIFTSREKAALHLQAGAKKVIISAPAKGAVDATVVLGVNDAELTGSEEIVSNASCTTNCLAPMVKVLDDALGVRRGYMTTVHAYTADQNLQDAPHRDLRRARAAAVSIIPTTTGAAKAVGEVIPGLKGKLHGLAVRTPNPTGSLADITMILGKDATVDEAHAALADFAAKNPTILQLSKEEIVSADIVGSPFSSIVDGLMTMKVGPLLKILAWYDNEAGYATRLVDLAKFVAKAG